MDETDLRMLIAQRRGEPRVHGNGFIQLDVAPDIRLHVWGHPDIPRQARYTGVHDHTFGFRSSVLRGRVFQVTYSRCSKSFGKSYRIYNPVTREGEDTVLVDSGAPSIRIDTAHIGLITQGKTYQMQPGAIHATVSDGMAATLMHKTKRVPDAVARVFVPEGVEPDNNFNRNHVLNSSDCWRIIEQVWSS